MKNPADFKVATDGPYVFKSRFKTALVRFMDRIGNLFSSPSKPVPWSSVKKVAVLRLDHIGDVLLALPCMEALIERLPQAQIDFFVGPWAKDAAELSGLKYEVKVFLAPWFLRGTARSWGWKSIKALNRTLQAGHYDVVIDLRGDFRHILAMKMAGIPVRIGGTRTGGGFWLTHPGQFKPELHEVDRNLDLLAQTGLEPVLRDKNPKLFPSARHENEAREIQTRLNLTKPVIVLHPTCAATAKRWPVESWKKLINGLPEGFDVVMIGTDGEKSDMQAIVQGCSRKVILAAGLFNLGALAAFLKNCALFIGVDSGPAHIAAAVGISVISLFSGTNSAAQWKPRGAQVNVFQNKVECSPCELTVCPIEHHCMTGIAVTEVAESITRLLRGRVSH
jgi:heptosyltransferase-2